MPDPFHDESLNRPRYKFVKGQGDDTHAKLLSDSKGYKAILMVYDSNPQSQADNQQVIVLMERT